MCGQSPQDQRDEQDETEQHCPERKLNQEQLACRRATAENDMLHRFFGLHSLACRGLDAVRLHPELNNKDGSQPIKLNADAKCKLWTGLSQRTLANRLWLERIESNLQDWLLNFWSVDCMNKTTVQMDQAGRVVLPKPLRDRFRLRGGDTLAVEVRGDAIELRPTQASGQLKRVNVVLVFTPAGPVRNEDFVAQSRDERIEDMMSGLKKD